MIRLAYLSTHYPSLSHTFIEREVRALRSLGAEIHTFSVRPAGDTDALCSHHARAAASTYCLLAKPTRLLTAPAAELLRRPGRVLRLLLEGQRLAPPGLRSRGLHAAYCAEAIVLAREMRRRGLNHVHVHFGHNGASVALLASRLDPEIEYSLSIHGSLEFFNVEAYRLREKIERATFVRCISSFCRAQVMSLCDPARWDRLPVVHCGLDVDRFAPSRRPRSEGTLRLLVVGRLDPIKGHPLVLEAIRRLRAEGLDVRLDVVGDGDAGAALRDQAAALGLGAHVTFHGAVGQDAIQERFEEADALVLASFMEGLPVVLMEAMAKGVPVVSTWVAGVPELVQDSVSGLLVEPSSVDALCAALRMLAHDPELGRELSRRGREVVRRRFSLRTTARRMFELFDRYAVPARAGIEGKAEAASGSRPAPAGSGRRPSAPAGEIEPNPAAALVEWPPPPGEPAAAAAPRDTTGVTARVSSEGG